MNQANLDRTPEEVAEIEKHKYFLSERAGYDVGLQVAEHDWESNHAERFRQSTIPKSEAQRAGGMGTLLKRVFGKRAR